MNGISFLLITVTGNVKGVICLQLIKKRIRCPFASTALMAKKSALNFAKKIKKNVVNVKKQNG